jgi:integrase
MPDDYKLGKHRGKYVIDFCDPAAVTDTNREGRVRRSLGTDDEGVAEAAARDFWARYTAAPSDRVADLWPIYLRDRLKEVARKDRFKATWAALEPHFGHRIGTAIDRDDCRAYYDARKAQGMADSTILTELQILRACLNLTLKDRAPKLWMPPESKPRTNYLTPEDVQKVHEDAKSPHIALFLELALATGARAGAICDLTWDRVDLKHGFVDLMPAGRIKTNKQRPTVRLTKRAMAALEKAKDAARTDHVIEFNGKPVKSVKKALQRISERTGIDFSPHVLRHSAGVWMAKANVPMQKISQFLGHASTKVTEKVYARYHPAHMEEAASALEW